MTSTPPPADDQPAEGAGRGTSARLTASFLRAVAAEVDGADLTPAALSRAAVQVLPVDGAGLSTLAGVLRLPLGASSSASRQAEELQSSLGEGPCLDAAEAQAAVVADRSALEARWPLYAEKLTGTTPYRAVAAVPLSAAGSGVFAALDLYSTRPQLSDRLDLHEVSSVASTAAALLTTCVAQIRDVSSSEDGPDWYRAAAGARHQVWVAIGMIMARRAVRTRDALGLLRARAYSLGRSLDDLAADVVDGRLALSDLIDRAT